MVINSDLRPFYVCLATKGAVFEPLLRVSKELTRLECKVEPQRDSQLDSVGVINGSNIPSSGKVYIYRRSQSYGLGVYRGAPRLWLLAGRCAFMGVSYLLVICYSIYSFSDRLSVGSLLYPLH